MVKFKFFRGGACGDLISIKFRFNRLCSICKPAFNKCFFLICISIIEVFIFVCQKEGGNAGITIFLQIGFIKSFVIPVVQRSRLI